MFFSAALELSDYIWLSILKSPNSPTRQAHLCPCNLHKNRQDRQIRQHFRPISGDVICIKNRKIRQHVRPISGGPQIRPARICIKIAKIAKFANTSGPSLSMQFA